jgi:hypothetical protein
MIAKKTQIEFVYVAINVYEQMYVPEFYITHRESINMHLESQEKIIEPNHLPLRHEITV